MRRILTATLGALALLGIPAAASAHHITGGTATCTSATASYASFSESNKPITYKVYADSVQVASGTGTFPGSSGSITATYPPLAKGTHTIKWMATWPGQGSANGGFSTVVADCEGPPVVVAPPVVTPQSAPVDVPAAAPPVQSAPVLPPAVHKKAKPKPKRCEFGRKRFDRHGHRLRDSKGRRITMCVVKHKAPVYRAPRLTG